jgi:hypothetical protein
LTAIGSLRRRLFGHVCILIIVDEEAAGLALPQLGVEPALRQQFVMRAFLDDAP